MRNMILFGVSLIYLAGCSGSVNERPEEPVVRVLVTTTEVNRGCLLDDENSEFRQVPISILRPGQFISEDDGFDLADRLRAGAVVAKEDLGPRGNRGLVQRMPPGMRIVSVKVSSDDLCCWRSNQCLPDKPR